MGPLLVVLTIALVTFGGYVAAGALSQRTEAPVTVSGVLRVSPLSGWELVRRSVDPPGARLTRGSGNLDFITIAFGGQAVDLARGYVNRYLEPESERLSVSPQFQPVRLPSGADGVRVHYVGLFGRGQTPIEGEVTAIVSPSGVGVVFDAWAPQGLLQYVVDDTRTMIEDAGVA